MQESGIIIKAPEGYVPRPIEPEEGQFDPTEELAGETPPVAPAAEPITPAVAEPAAPTPAEPDFESIFREKIGMDPKEVAAIVEEYTALKKRKFIDDEELVATSDFEKDLLRTIKRGGDPKSFVNSVYTDYAKMTAEEIIKHDILSEDPSMPKGLLERKYKARLLEFGWSDELEPDDKEFNEILGYESNKLRLKHAEIAQKYKVPEKANAPQVDSSELQAQYQRELMDNEAVKNLQLTKKVVFGEFEYATDPNEVVGMIADPSKLALKFTKPDGSADIDKMLKWYALASDPDAAIKLAVDSALKKQKLEVIKQDVNPAEPSPAAPVTGTPTIRWGVSKK